MKPNTVWGYFWEKDIQKNCRAEKKLLRAAAAIPGGNPGAECNMRCIFCFTKCGTRFSNDKCIDNRTTIQFLKEASKYAYDKKLMNYFLVSEGEPTLNPELIPMLYEISSLGGTITLFSNLMELSSEVIQAFGDIKNLFVCGKMYGFTEETNDYLTGIAGSYLKMKENIGKLITKGLADEGRLGVQSVLTSRNIDECFDIFKWARRNKIVPHLMMFRKQGYGENMEELELPIERLNQFFVQCSEYDKEHYSYLWDEKLPLMIHGDCQIPGINIYLTNNGELKLCACDDSAVGNYFSDKLEDVLSSERFESARENGGCLMYKA